jgi:hypothetical protein
VLFTNGITHSDSEGVGYEVDIGYDVEFRFPVDRKVDRGIGEFVVETDGAHRSEIGLGTLPADIAADTPEPGKGRDSADKLVAFIETAQTKPVAKGDKAFEGIGLVNEIFNTDGIADGRIGRAETDTDRHFVVLCRQTIAQTAKGQEDEAKGDGAHRPSVLSRRNEMGGQDISGWLLELS